MAISLEQYVAEATNAYKPAQTAIQNQLNALSGQQETATQQINKNYAQQQAGLNRQRNMAAETASLQAAGSGGSFGGAANIANRKYYDQSFVPAQTQLQTNQANELAQNRQNFENQRTSLNSQLSNLESQANQQALQQYWAAVEAEKQRAAQLQAQREANAAQNRYYELMADRIKNSGQQSGNKVWDFGNGFTLIQGDDGRSYYKKNGQQVSAAAFLAGTSNNSNKWDLWNDVWNNGVNTYGIGADTVDKFGRGGAKGLSNYMDLTRI